MKLKECNKKYSQDKVYAHGLEKPVHIPGFKCIKQLEDIS